MDVGITGTSLLHSYSREGSSFYASQPAPNAVAGPSCIFLVIVATDGKRAACTEDSSRHPTIRFLLRLSTGDILLLRMRDSPLSLR